MIYAPISSSAGALRRFCSILVNMDPNRSACNADAPRSSVAPDGRFIVGVHRPAYRVDNLRASQTISVLGQGPGGREVTNHLNFPTGGVDVPSAAEIFEIANALPWRGTTYIGKDWADRCAESPLSIQLPPKPPVSMHRWLREVAGPLVGGGSRRREMLTRLPDPIKLALATTSTDSRDLEALAEHAACFVHAEDSRPTGLEYRRHADHGLQPDIRNHPLFEAVANNPCLPDDYKTAMVLRPGAQGASAITGEWGASGEKSHVYEYLRRNSYIPWGHFAANMAEDAVRYDAAHLAKRDMHGMRHLYYQRTFVRLARQLDLRIGGEAPLDADELERLRQDILAMMADADQAAKLAFNATLWGWNYGFDYAPTQYRLHASHQQVHQQYALVPREVRRLDTDRNPHRKVAAYACGDLLHGLVRDYRQAHGVDFFKAYFQAIQRNARLDGRTDRDQNLVVHADRHVMLFVPKAQTSQWELQLVTLAPVGNILEADPATRKALDQGIWIAIRTLGGLGARMVTAIEYAKRFDSVPAGQHLLYSFLPRLPESPGAFSEAQLRWIIGHYPEDFAAACRAQKPADRA
ncbi:MAG: hypothetical protein QNJ04_03285 [Desulfobacterales bacterium]|nr:hypothetical protein [Desulfobacterales bacterium]